MKTTRFSRQSMLCCTVIAVLFEIWFWVSFCWIDLQIEFFFLSRVQTGVDAEVLRNETPSLLQASPPSVMTLTLGEIIGGDETVGGGAACAMEGRAKHTVIQ